MYYYINVPIHYFILSGPDFKFPITKFGKNCINLKFQLSWLHKWKWLAYSNIDNGAYCKYCVLYAKNEVGSGNQSLGQLCFKPFQAWKKAHEKFNKHESSNYHKQSLLEYQLHYSIASNKTLPINLQLDTIKNRQRENNRKIIVPVIETIIFCGRQGIT